MKTGLVLFGFITISMSVCLAADPNPAGEASSNAQTDSGGQSATSPAGKGEAVEVSDSNEVIRFFGAFRAKTMGVLPEGWDVVPSEDPSTSIIMPLSLPNGKTGKFTIKPYVLAPVAAPGTYIVKEPGFDPSKGLEQENTVGAVLTEFVEEQEKLNVRLESMVAKMRQELDAARRASPPKSPTTAAAPKQRTGAGRVQQ